MTTNDVFVYQAIKTPQFWLIWIVLFCNTTAGIGVLGQASAMSQEMFPGHITAVAAAGLVGLMSLFNMGGRFSWASLSDYIGRKNTYFVYMTLGFALYVTVPYAGGSGNVVLFVICFLIIVSMYGGGFSTVPAYLRDMFGTRYVGAIHGILLTAWSAAGIAGPVLINYIREYNVTHGVPKAQAYNTTMYIMAGLLVVGFIANFCVKAVDKRHHMKPETDADLARAAHKEANMDPSHAETPFSQLLFLWAAFHISRIIASMKPKISRRPDQRRRRRNRQSRRRIGKIMQNTSTSETTTLQLVLAWSFAGIPLLAGVAQTLVNAMKLFQ